MTTRSGPVRANADVLAGLLLLAVTAVAFAGAHGGGPSVWLFPRLTAGVVGLCGVLLLVQGIRRAEPVVLWDEPGKVREVGVFAASLVVYAAILRWVGFWLASGVLVGGGAFVLGRSRSPRHLFAWLVGGMALSLAMDALFVGVFGVPLPGGLLWDGARWRPWVP